MTKYNKAILMGNVTHTPELRITKEGMKILKLRLAVDGRRTCFIDCTAFSGNAEILSQYVKKGSLLHVDGRLDYSTWESKDGSGKRSKHEVIIENFSLMPRRQDTTLASPVTEDEALNA
jgi:single-strand DNA-binding protein